MVSMMSDSRKAFMEAAVAAARAGMADGRGGPFGAVVVKDGQIVATGENRVVRNGDPTAHAEVVAIREACRTLNTHVLTGCELFATTEPCPMCLSAIYWARLDRVWYAATREDAARVGFDDELIYREVALAPADRRLPMTRLETAEAKDLLDAWLQMPHKVHY